MTDVQTPRRSTFKHSPRVLPRPHPSVTNRPRVLETRSERDDRRTRRLGMLGWTLAAMFLIVGGVLLSHSNGVATSLETRAAGLENERTRLEEDILTRDQHVAAQAEQIGALTKQIADQREAATDLRGELVVVSEERDRIVQAIRFLEQQRAEAPGPVVANQPQVKSPSRARTDAASKIPTIDVLGMRLPPLSIPRSP